MDIIPRTQVEARLAHIRRQKAHHEQLMQLEQEEQRLLALQGGAAVGHLPTPAHLLPSTEMPTPTPSGVSNAVDLTTPPQPKLGFKREPKQETDEAEDFQAQEPVDQERHRQRTPPLDSDDVPLQRRATPRRERGGGGNYRVFDSPPRNEPPTQQQDALPNARPTKKKNPGEPDLTPVVDDVEYRTIIKKPDGDRQGLVEVVCKFCEANSTLHSGVKVLYYSMGAWRSHIGNCHRRDLPAGTKLSSRYIMENCLKMRKLTSREEKAVLNHKHADFAVVKKVGPGAEPDSGTRKRRQKRGIAAVKSPEEDEAERGILSAIEDPLEPADVKPDTERLERLKRRRHNSSKGDVSSDAYGGDPSAAEEEEAGDLEDGSENRTLGMSTRKGGRRTRYTPDFKMGKLD